MDDALCVRLGQPFGDLRRDLDGGVDVERPGLELLLERLPVVVRHDDEQPSIAGEADVVNRADVAVVGGRRGLRLADEALLGALVVAPLRGQELQRHEPPELRVARGVDDTHPAAANLGEDVVLGDGRADQRVGRRLRQEW